MITPADHYDEFGTCVGYLSQVMPFPSRTKIDAMLLKSSSVTPHFVFPPTVNRVWVIPEVSQHLFYVCPTTTHHVGDYAKVIGKPSRCSI